MERLLKFASLFIAVSAVFFVLPVCATAEEVEEVVITAPRSVRPLTIQMDPKAPQQPVPAADGAAFLKNIPGFSNVRKGGTDGDPVFRGMSGSRVSILADGHQVYGGCGGRMDPPTAFIYPDLYDRVTVLKGPQSVLYAPGASAATVIFERESKRFAGPDGKFMGSLLMGSNGRMDQIADMRAGTPDVYVKASGMRADADDYKDGNGVTYHSFYHRWSSSFALGWTPDDNTVVEVSTDKSDAQAANADRTMDETKDARASYAFKLEKKNVTPLVEKLTLDVYSNHVDHVMDNFSLASTPPASFSAMNPDRTTTGGRIVATLALTDSTKLVLGADQNRDVERAGANGMMKSSAAASIAAYSSGASYEHVSFSQYGFFAEATKNGSEGGKIIGGLRVDLHSAQDMRPCVGAMMCPGNPNNTLGQRDEKSLPSGFVRYEQDHETGAYYIGLGHSERFADYWERASDKIPGTTKSAFLTIKPEKTTQLDVGNNWNSGVWSGSLSGYFSQVQDYILMAWDKGYTRNVDARIWGFEGDFGYAVSEEWKLISALSYTYADNITDGKPLAQQSPPEAKVTAQYDDQRFSFAAVTRMVAAQDRYDIGSGNIVLYGKDLGRTDEFMVFSLNAGWRPSKNSLVTAGVDNVLNKAYAEHISGASANISGYLQPTGNRVNEPGRTFWMKVNVNF
ncbi:MAG: TonB-dependent copper receptor [Nitrospinae bacterium]|nr:TonB-dependent copper receptor [Nitrospinota bacterium]